MTIIKLASYYFFAIFFLFNAFISSTLFCWCCTYKHHPQMRYANCILQISCNKSAGNLHILYISRILFIIIFSSFFYIGTFFKIQKQVLQVNTSILGITSLWEFTISQRVSPFIPAPVAQGAGPTLNLGPPLWQINKWATPSPFTHCRYAAPRDICTEITHDPLPFSVILRETRTLLAVPRWLNYCCIMHILFVMSAEITVVD
jgi:hypothetical protein